MGALQWETLFGHGDQEFLTIFDSRLAKGVGVLATGPVFPAYRTPAHPLRWLGVWLPMSRSHFGSSSLRLFRLCVSPSQSMAGDIASDDFGDAAFGGGMTLHSFRCRLGYAASRVKILPQFGFGSDLDLGIFVCGAAFLPGLWVQKSKFGSIGSFVAPRFCQADGCRRQFMANIGAAFRDGSRHADGRQYQFCNSEVYTPRWVASRLWDAKSIFSFWLLHFAMVRDTPAGGSREYFRNDHL